MVAGIVSTAAGFDLVINRPTGSTPMEWVALILSGPILFLASKASDFYTGHVLYADGGYTAG